MDIADIEDTTSNPSQSILVTAKNPGTTTFVVSGKGEDLNGTGFTFYEEITIEVYEKKTSNPPSQGVDDPSRPGYTESKPEPQAPQETEAEKAERLEREKKEEEERKKAEIEESKKVPLVSSINVISASDKLNGEVLKTIETESEKFDYEYTLPRRIDAFKLDLKSDANLDYVKDHKFADGENEKKIVVKAHNDDFEQTINILIKRNTDTYVERKVGDKSLAVYEDELLDALMKEKGFERKTFKEGDQEVSYFTKGKVNMQLLVDDKNNGQWYLLNDKNEAVKPLAMVLDKDGNVLFILEANEEMRKETLHGNKYETKSRDLGKEFANIDKELKIENKYGAWEFADGEIVWAMNENLEEGLYHIANDGTIKAAVVAFDQVDGKMKNIALGTSIALVGLIAANIAYFVVTKTKKDEII
ncbi:MAG TPA: hypothetical protein VIG45_03280 [Erysipelothrix sp.]